MPGIGTIPNDCSSNNLIDLLVLMFSCLHSYDNESVAIGIREHYAMVLVGHARLVPGECELFEVGIGNGVLSLDDHCKAGSGPLRGSGAG